ncbi:MAG TPA: hypothetical protein VKA70_18280 [Blastocatellia bacterium]|nr:hypothetical protein [Blastocatellia bacterium]
MPVIHCVCGEIYLFEDYSVPLTYWCSKCGEEVPVSLSGEPRRATKRHFKPLPVLATLVIFALAAVLIIFALKPKKATQARQKARGNSSAPIAAKTTPPSEPAQVQSYTTPPLVRYGGAERSSLSLGSSPLGEGVRGGLSTLTVENKTDMDAFVRVLKYKSDDGLIRNFYIPAGGSYTAEEVPPGRYSLRVGYGLIWSLLEERFSPELLASESKPFNITEKKTRSGTQYSQMTITLTTTIKD